jgi:hypothetical protein
VVLALKRGAASGEEFLSLATHLHQRGYIHDQPRELRSPMASSRRIELTCTFFDAEAIRRWPKDREIKRRYATLFRDLLTGPPKVVPAHDIYLEGEEIAVCHCRRPPFFLLRGYTLETSGALLCGDCGFARPNYRLPAPVDIEVWASLNASIYHVWLYGGPLEDWGARQLEDPASELNVRGRDLATATAAKVGAPVYLALFMEWPLGKPECPHCGGRGEAIPHTWPNWVCGRCALAY